MILDITRKIYDAKIVDNPEAKRLYLKGERSWDIIGVRWTGSSAIGNQLRLLLGI